ncbi:hypothetical protein A3A09_01855 [Candidatus Nomurabacteria bacterium RIFCSPLOWO2_01_FULL_42_20]|uniref:Uncharacterized protein n=1 Tax=Candidatus Nomurabacteria bacterium RIFCSPHIGHO2_01_FULL_42_16 TaxID=1801743 RepID=A0A1F6VMA9_9BACT|nr:MAG: hypothetical protein A2824_01190 [Candidatus Nomurabacteria bacterium RIFCSPHIGHO2_01_FULL_42_16]OGI91365.1 MAG: hypothetical protein A3A09_01855 [Candidatus Nomurabacteria bacterium RIFCSPLOWO2_01_FULL_42_20]
MINPEKFEEKSDPIKKFNDFKIKLAANSLYLPNYKELKEAFSLLDSSDMEKYDMETALSHLFVGKDLKNTPFEIWTKEYVEQLSYYLIERLKALKENDPNTQNTVLEVGARDGRLSHFLKNITRKINSFKDSGLDFVATDNPEKYKKDWTILPNIPLEKIDYKDAIEKFKPTLVICSWMPENEDWTEFFRSKPFIKEYILVGNIDKYGDFEKTWGGREIVNLLGKAFLTTANKNIPNEVMDKIKKLPFYKDGFDLYSLKRLESYQVDHSTYFYTKPLDKSEWKYSYARSVSFRRRDIQ